MLRIFPLRVGMRLLKIYVGHPAIKFSNGSIIAHEKKIFFSYYSFLFGQGLLLVRLDGRAQREGALPNALLFVPFLSKVDTKAVHLVVNGQV
jgi:hypothetical protein